MTATTETQAAAIVESLWIGDHIRKSEPRKLSAVSQVVWCQATGKHPFFSSAMLAITEADLPIIEAAVKMCHVRAMEIEGPLAREWLNAATARAANPEDEWDHQDALWSIERAQETLDLAAQWGVVA